LTRICITAAAAAPSPGRSRDDRRRRCLCRREENKSLLVNIHSCAFKVLVEPACRPAQGRLAVMLNNEEDIDHAGTIIILELLQNCWKKGGAKKVTCTFFDCSFTG
jgi:hypothetical protein